MTYYMISNMDLDKADPVKLNYVLIRLCRNLAKGTHADAVFKAFDKVSYKCLLYICTWIELNSLAKELYIAFFQAEPKVLLDEEQR